MAAELLEWPPGATSQRILVLVHGALRTGALTDLIVPSLDQDSQLALSWSRRGWNRHWESTRSKIDVKEDGIFV